MGSLRQQVVCMGHPIKEVLSPVSLLRGRGLFGFGESCHEKGAVSDPSDGFICINSLHVPLLGVLLELKALRTFGH